MRTCLRVAVCALALTACAAQEPSGGLHTEERESSIETRLYPAELVMDHQAALGLDEAQVSAIQTELQASQRELVDAEWALRREREALSTALSGAHVDEEAAMQAAERVIEQESAIKRLHLRLLIRIKSHLTPEQQQRLETLRGDVNRRGSPRSG